MLRVKGSFRNGRKEGARPNLHNFRSSGSGIPFRDQIAVEVKEKVEAKVEAAEVVETAKKKKKAGRPKKEK